MSYLKKTYELQSMLEASKDIEALGIFFHHNVIITEKPSGEVRRGIEAQKKAIFQWIDKIEEFHEGGTKSITSNEALEISMVESWIRVTFKGSSHPIMLEEISVYRWEGGKIKSLDFYYHDPFLPLDRR